MMTAVTFGVGVSYSGSLGMRRSWGMREGDACKRTLIFEWHTGAEIIQSVIRFYSTVENLLKIVAV